LLARAGLPITGPDLGAEALLECMQVDKKAARGRTRFVLLSGIGRADVRENIDAAALRASILSCAPAPKSAAAQ